MTNLSNIKLEKIPDWIKIYLSPSDGKRAKLAFQFTINGITYPFVRKLNFAALPDPPRERRYSMLAALYLARPGDLIFFFQSDPQWRNDDINSRRGLRGIYRIISSPFRGTDNIEDAETGYKILGKCPKCGTFHSTLRASCLLCGANFPTLNIPSRSEPYHNLLLSLRLLIEPLIVFERSVSDERCYADMTDTGMVWVGRHDNQMGAGKGSSVRQLLPEEAVKITRMMITEPGQKIAFPPRYNYNFEMKNVLNPDGASISDLELRNVNSQIKMVAQEHMLNFDISKNFDDPNSSFVSSLQHEYEVSCIEYVSSEFPWGYTAGESDFVITMANEKGRYRVFIMEFKRDKIDDCAIIQTSLYTRWVIQAISQFARPTPKAIEVVPIAIGRRLAPATARPMQYSYNASFNSGVSLPVEVVSPLFIKYIPENEFIKGDKIYAKNLKFVNESEKIPKIKWLPEPGMVTSQVELNWVKNNSWKLAKEGAHLTSFE